ncbi:MAG TPA: hypothetical protein VMU93_06430 [Caulobacteraceae bacterium]|nr:hypothetical protein [Caulobacteraceae bacterium]
MKQLVIALAVAAVLAPSMASAHRGRGSGFHLHHFSLRHFSSRHFGSRHGHRHAAYHHARRLGVHRHR